jgi:lambda repressor-like predicted transcriptional regulator
MNSGIIRVGVEAVALCGPGLPDWPSSRLVLAGAAPYRPAPIVLDAPAQLSPAERRRAVPSVRLALGVAAAAVAQSGLDPKTLPAVFTSSGADGETIAAILSALATPEREVSPTRFHNSVHNAPSGYWGIAVQSREAVSSVSGYDASFAMGLLEAAVQTMTAGRPTLLVAYDLPYPHPLDSVRQIDASFGVAMILSPLPSNGALATLRLRIAGCHATSTCSDPCLEALRRGNPAARALPLLVRFAAGGTECIGMDLSHGALEIDVEPC